MGWNAGNGSNAFSPFIADTAALSHTQANSNSNSSGNGGTSNAAGSSLATGAAASGLVINVVYDYDSSVSSAPAAFVTQINAAVQYLESPYNDPITVTIAVGYGEIGGSAQDAGALGESETYLSSFSYSLTFTWFDHRQIVSLALGLEFSSMLLAGPQPVKGEPFDGPPLPPKLSDFLRRPH